MQVNAMSKALDAIHDIAGEALALEMSADVKEKLSLILSIAHYKFDVRSNGEIKGSKS